MRPDSPSDPAPRSSPTPRMRRRGVLLLLGLLALCAAVIALVYGPLLAQGVPVGEQRVTYTPPQGPTSPILLDSRPDEILRQYLTDYIRLAGTYPCARNPTSYEEIADPLLSTGHCGIIRSPVASFLITSVTIQAHGLLSRPRALVNLTVRYRDGSQWNTEIEMIPDEMQGPWPFATHLTCWFGAGTLLMFGQLTPDIPSGAEYAVGDSSPPMYRCKP